ncbi:FkbM family methyltransferase [Pseudoalteromonas arctica]|uniref:FkbM family methyltransferase n=1 Tax=Pseudoalteromonas arctica TaxID=394751 RepID=A0AAP6Y1Q4_9GAMM|nr:FkbM family methyltransferase [Pseudoalteromonas arctica]NMP03417.1 FkbM family methyltransferase [Pseudoalteromonas arctica]
MIDLIIKSLESSDSLATFLKNYYTSAINVDPKEVVVCFGLNENTIKLLEYYPINFIVDDSQAGTIVSKTPVISKEQVPKGCLIINCSFSIYPRTVSVISNTLQPKKVIPFMQVAAFSDNDLLPDFVKSTYDCWRNRLEKLKLLYNRFEDEESRLQFLNVIIYRLTGDNCRDFGFSVDFDIQYFEDFIRPYAKGVFVDGGGYTGDTAQGYLNFFSGEFSALHVFEPDKGNCIVAENKFSSYENIYIYPVGLSNKNEKLKFCNLNTTFSSFSDEGNVEISVTKIDDSIDGKIDYIKLDVEGFDFKAIQGAKRHIIKDTPCMAIAVYHDSNHFWQIPDFVLSLNSSYRLRFRHYSEGWSESIIYFLPNKS